MPERTVKPEMKLGAESLELTRSDGKIDTINLLEMLDGDDADSKTVQWAILMKLDQISQYQKGILETNTAILQGTVEVAKGMQALVQISSRPVQMPDQAEAIKNALGAVGLSPEMFGAAMKAATGQATAAGVSVERPNGEDKE